MGPTPSSFIKVSKHSHSFFFVDKREPSSWFRKLTYYITTRFQKSASKKLHFNVQFQSWSRIFTRYNRVSSEYIYIYKLDGVGPVDNRPSPD